MIVIHYSSAFKAVNSFIDSYNEKVESKKDRLRTGTVMTAKELIRIYGISLLKANGSIKIDQKNLPTLQTNNVQLSKLVKCSTRTIQRHLIKLKKAGFILKKVFHGSNSNFELLINPTILFIKQSIDVDKMKNALAQAFSRSKQQDDPARVPAVLKTNCPHTYSRNNRNINNILITVSNRFKTSGNGAGYIGGYTGEIARSVPETIQKMPETGEIASRAEKSENLNLSPDPARDNSLNLYVSLLWMMSRNLLYRHTDLTDNQVLIAKKLIRKLYDPVPTERLHLTHQHYSDRIALVSKYLKKDPARFVPLPYKYFDTTNGTGFVGTKKWYYDDLKRKIEVHRELTLSRLIRKYQNNEKKPSAHKKQPLQLFRECENTLGKFDDPSLVQRFHAAVLQYETYREISYSN
jgi:hypothetical protein